MGYNPFLPTAGARVNILCIPAGPITPDRFQKFIKALQNAAKVERKAVDSTPASGSIIYDISATQDKWRPHLFPFETNSRCQVLLGLVDGERLVDARASSSGEDKGGALQVSDTIESIKTRFEEQQLVEPGLAVRRLVYCGTELEARLSHDLLCLPDTDDAAAAHEVMIALSRQLIERLTTVVNDLKDQPISMVPGVASQTPQRTGTTPVPASGTSTPVSTKTSSPMPMANGGEQQVCLHLEK
jgi:hypothetical protein